MADTNKNVIIGYMQDMEHVTFPRLGLHTHRRYTEQEALELLPSVRKNVKLAGGYQWEIFKLEKVSRGAAPSEEA